MRDHSWNIQTQTQPPVFLLDWFPASCWPSFSLKPQICLKVLKSYPQMMDRVDPPETDLHPPPEAQSGIRSPVRHQQKSHSTFPQVWVSPSPAPVPILPLAVTGRSAISCTSLLCSPPCQRPLPFQQRLKEKYLTNLVQMRQFTSMGQCESRIRKETFL